MKKFVEIFADGACRGNPGPGGYGAILKYNEHEKEISGYNPDTTNNQMELMAVIEALKCLKCPCKIKITTDSKYVTDGMTLWINNWRKNGWRKANKQSIKNLELWQELFRLSIEHDIEWTWVKGHNGNYMNERCDRLAVLAINSS